jgi:hypothetical protein
MRNLRYSSILANPASATLKLAGQITTLTDPGYLSLPRVRMPRNLLLMLLEMNGSDSPPAAGRRVLLCARECFLSLSPIMSVSPIRRVKINLQISIIWRHCSHRVAPVLCLATAMTSI